METIIKSSVWPSSVSYRISVFHARICLIMYSTNAHSLPVQNKYFIALEPRTEPYLQLLTLRWEAAYFLKNLSISDCQIWLNYEMVFPDVFKGKKSLKNQPIAIQWERNVWLLSLICAEIRWPKFLQGEDQQANVAVLLWRSSDGVDVHYCS